MQPWAPQKGPRLWADRGGRGGPTARDFAKDFPPHVLREYALLADGERGILAGPRGDFVWMCAPRWHDDAVFSHLVGGQGIYAVSPVAERYVWGGYYEPRSLIWRDRWVTTGGFVECREALARPASPSTAIVLRQPAALDSPSRVRVVLQAAAMFGTEGMRGLRSEGGIWEFRSGPLYFRWSGAEAARMEGGALTTEIDLGVGRRHDLVLEVSSQPLPREIPDPSQLWAATETAWQRSVPEQSQTVAARDAVHANAVLQGLTSQTGGMVAAATTSLPEKAEKDRSYDYRYVWIRDQAYAGRAAGAIEPHPLLDSAVQFLSERILSDGHKLVPAYRVDGGRLPEERLLEHLAGYPGGSNRVGNHVNEQFQLDAFGEALMLFAVAAGHDHMDLDHWRAAEMAADAIERRWQEADAGIWETEQRRWAHSRLICVAGLRDIAGHAPAPQASQWSALADAISADVSSDCLHPTGRWQRADDDERVDAALLLASLRGAIPASDPRSLATLDAVRRDLCRDGFVYRFRHGDVALGDAEGAFLLCGFFMALAEHQQGRPAEALAWFERSRSACGPPGLFTEEFDVLERQLRGNMPQAFVHALLWEASARLARPWEETRASPAWEGPKHEQPR